MVRAFCLNSLLPRSTSTILLLSRPESDNMTPPPALVRRRRGLSVIGAIGCAESDPPIARPSVPRLQAYPVRLGGTESPGLACARSIAEEAAASLSDGTRSPGISDPPWGFILAVLRRRGLEHSPSHSREGTMQIIRREFLGLSGLAVAAPSITTIALAQAQAGPKLTQILRKDLEGQDHVVQETVLSIVEFPPGAAAPWHMHPGAQELLHVIEGNLVVEIEGKGSTLLKAGEAGIIPAELVHLARNESASANGKALVVHSRAAKDKPLIVVVKK